MKKTVAIIFLAYVFGACQGSQEKRSLDEMMKSHSGIWTMYDAVSMRTFVGIDPEPKGPYCMDFQPKFQRALVRFLDRDKLFKIKVLPYGNKRYLFGTGKFIREFMIASDQSPHEATFSDETSLAGFLYIASDGRQSDYHTLGRCVEEQKKGEWTSEYWTKNYNKDGNTPWQKKESAQIKNKPK